MAKIRGVKPTYWTDDAIVELSIPARLLFIGLWNFACDNGHVEDKPKQVKMRIFPADDVDVNGLLAELEGQGRIKRADGYIVIPKFAEHQKPHTRWWLTCDQPLCNVPEGATSTPPNRGATVAQPVRNRVATADGDGEGDGDGDGEGEKGAQATPGPRKRGHRLPEDFAITADMRAWAKDQKLDHLNLDLLTAEFKDYWQGVAGAKGVKLDWFGTWRNWIRRKATDHHPALALASSRPDAPRRVGLAFVPTCPTCGAPPEDVHDPECPDQSWRPNTEGIGL